MVRPEPARSAIVPDATWLTIGILNNCDGMSGAVTSTTTVAPAVPVRPAVTMSFDSAGGPTAPSCEQATTAARAKERTRNRVWDMVPVGGQVPHPSNDASPPRGGWRPQGSPAEVLQLCNSWAIG